MLHCRFTTVTALVAFQVGESICRPNHRGTDSHAVGGGVEHRVSNTRIDGESGLRNEERNMLSCSRHPQSVHHITSFECLVRNI